MVVFNKKINRKQREISQTLWQTKGDQGSKEREIHRKVGPSFIRVIGAECLSARTFQLSYRVVKK